jgi:hypothetical protein
MIHLVGGHDWMPHATDERGCHEALEGTVLSIKMSWNTVVQ